MKGKIQYKSKINGECVTDYDFSTITDNNELKFLQWMNELQDSVAQLNYNVKMYEYYVKLYLLNDVVRDKLKTYYILCLSNLSRIIVIDFSRLLQDSNKLDLLKFRNFCSQNQSLFLRSDTSIKLKRIKKTLNDAKKLYEDYFKDIRNEIFAHSDEILLEKQNVETKFDASGSTVDMNKILRRLKRSLNEIWMCYNNHKLCFQLENGDDYKKITKIICKHYGDTLFT